MENEYYQLGAKLKYHDFAVSSTVSFECICDLNDRLVGIDKYSSQPHLYTNTLTTGIKIEHSVDVYMHNRRRKKRAFLFAVVMEYTRYFWIRWLKMVVCFFLLTVRFGLFLNAPIYFVRDKVMLFRHICDFFLFFCTNSVITISVIWIVFFSQTRLMYRCGFFPNRFAKLTWNWKKRWIKKEYWIDGCMKCDDGVTIPLSDNFIL